MEIRNLTQGDDSRSGGGRAGAADRGRRAVVAQGPRRAAVRRAGAPSAADTRHVRRMVEERAARSLERVGPAGWERYQFAHASLLSMPRRCRTCVTRNTGSGSTAGRPVAGPPARPTPEPARRHPQYLLDTYPATLSS